jgi:peptide/nickel transport system substrate-binding protein
LRTRLILGLAAAACAACGSATADAAEPRGGSFVYGRRSDSLFLDPVLNDANADIWVLTNLYDTLILPADDGKSLLPGLATSWEASADGRTFTLKLRAGAMFSDGSPITAEDVVWSLERARNPKEGIWSFMLSAIEAVSTEGASSVVLRLKRPDPSLPAALATFNAAIMPKKLFEAEPGADDDERAKAFAEHPVGSGPFTLASWTRASSMVLRRNPHYWALGDDDKPLPYLDEVRFEIIPEDATRILKLRSGEIDGAEFIPYPRVKELQADSDVDMRLFPSVQTSYLQINSRPRLADGRDNPLSRVEVRRALNYAVNKSAVIQIVTHGLGTPMRSFMASATPLFADQGPAYPYDPGKAKSLLAAAGFANGFALSCMVLAGSADDLTVASAIQQMWGQVGVRLSIEQADAATMQARYQSGTFQLRTGSWTNDIDDPNEVTAYFDWFPNIQNQHGGWDSPESDALFEASQSETDPAKRAADYKRLQELYMAEAPIVFLFESPYAVALSRKVHGFWQSPLGATVFVRATVDR